MCEVNKKGPVCMYDLWLVEEFSSSLNLDEFFL
jgi:hypothetical protein